MARWFILRTGGGQTLPLMRSLREAGFDVWSPARTIRRVRFPNSRSERRDEIDVPILPTFVFAREAQLEALAVLAGDPAGARPGFSIFRHGGRTPLIRDSEVAGLREEEERAAATARAMRAAETREEAERIRIAAMKSDAARRRATKEMERARLAAFRTQRCAVEPGTAVEVAEMPALVGVAGVVEAIDGSVALVRFGSQSWKIDGWRLMPSTLDTSAPRGLAA